MARIVSLTVLTTLIVFLGITFFRVIAPFLLPLFLAGVTAVLCQPLYGYFCRKTKNRPRVAAGLTTVAVLSIFLIPLLVGTFIGSVQLYSLAQETVGSAGWNDAMEKIRGALEIDQIVQRLDPYIVGEIDAEKLQQQIHANLKKMLTALAQRSLGIAAGALGFLGSLVSVIISLLMFAIALYYFLADGPALLAASEGLIPVHIEYQRQLLQQFNKVVRSVVLATFLAAVSQGILTAVLLWAFGFGHFFFTFIIATLASLIPLAGTWLVWGPCAIWLFTDGSPIQATIMTLIGALVIGTLDNVIRTYVLQNDTKLHPLLAFVSVLGGLQAMGLWGVFIGPTVACCLHALIRIFNIELQEFSKERFAEFLEQPAANETAPAKLESAAKDESSATTGDGNAESAALPPDDSPAEDSKPSDKGSAPVGKRKGAQ